MAASEIRSVMELIASYQAVLRYGSPDGDILFPARRISDINRTRDMAIVRPAWIVVKPGFDCNR